MSKPARGTKRVCPSCGARFYDLGRSPITCSVCQAVYQISAPSSRRAERAAPVAKTPKPEAEEKEPPIVGGADVISLDEAAEAEEAAVDDEAIVDLGDDDDDIPADDDDDDTFLEADEEGDDDVTDIVKGGPKEES
ncbi:MAG: TIGR02300 family protein [Methyloceanibacter sp.]|uniref:TIGR02300 family protein n=1 Tax=Methyloceanibacter sp. TaxID=1965321 RepID=UPI003EDEFAF2